MKSVKSWNVGTAVVKLWNVEQTLQVYGAKKGTAEKIHTGNWVAGCMWLDACERQVNKVEAGDREAIRLNLRIPPPQTQQSSKATTQQESPQKILQILFARRSSDTCHCYHLGLDTRSSLSWSGMKQARPAFTRYPHICRRISLQYLETGTTSLPYCVQYVILVAICHSNTTISQYLTHEEDFQDLLVFYNEYLLSIMFFFVSAIPFVCFHRDKLSAVTNQMESLPFLLYADQ